MVNIGTARKALPEGAMMTLKTGARAGRRRKRLRSRARGQSMRWAASEGTAFMNSGSFQPRPAYAALSRDST